MDKVDVFGAGVLAFAIAVLGYTAGVRSGDERAERELRGVHNFLEIQSKATREWKTASDGFEDAAARNLKTAQGAFEVIEKWRAEAVRMQQMWLAERARADTCGKGI